MRDVYLSITLEYIINTVDIKQFDGVTGLFAHQRFYLCKYLSSLARSQLKLCMFLKDNLF